ncbi:porin family protein [Prevotella melaninogenica]|uniref:porin family protein n=1 Tax=Prevotella melaninogenica TaxID=28132 RepID=UPI00242041D6|nr:porin family protein [Prevotella melaninogenica]
MKRIAILIVLVTSTLVSMAQNKPGTWSVIPHVGVSMSSLLGGSGIYETGIDEVVEIKPHALLGFVGGADVMYQASEVVGVSAGLSFVQAGCKFKDGKGKNSVVYNRNLRMNYVAMPILIHSYLLPGFSVKAGIEPTLLLGARSHEVQQSFDVDKEGKKSNFSEDEFTIDVKKGMRKIGLSIPIGVSYEYENVVLGALYHVGVFKIYKEGDSARNSVVELSVGYKFNL